MAVVSAMDSPDADDPAARPPPWREEDSSERGIAAAPRPCAISTAGFGAADGHEDPASLLRSVTRHVRAGEHDAAIDALTRLAELIPADARVYYWRA
ncbi:MAG: hypothetical protein ACYTFI_06610, partial [Planctomycetota bacterium]